MAKTTDKKMSIIVDFQRELLIRKLVKVLRRLPSDDFAFVYNAFKVALYDWIEKQSDFPQQPA